MKTRVVNIRKEGHDVYIGRGSPFGNPFVIGKDGNRAEVIALYKKWFYNKLKNNWQFRRNVIVLKSLTLGCYCKPLACHGDVIVDYLEKESKCQK